MVHKAGDEIPAISQKFIVHELKACKYNQSEECVVSPADRMTNDNVPAYWVLPFNS